MRKLVCDVCGKTVRSLYVFGIKFVGEQRIGGYSLSWDGAKGMMDRGERRYEIEACLECAQNIIEAVRPVIGRDDDEEGEDGCVRP